MKNKRELRLSEGQLKRIVKESVGRVMKEAYGTPASGDWQRFKDLNTASNPLTSHRTADSSDELISAISRINSYVTNIHYELYHLDDDLSGSGKTVKRIGDALDGKCEEMLRLLKLLCSKLQMETGEQPSTSVWNKGRYYDFAAKEGRRKSEEMFNN